MDTKSIRQGRAALRCVSTRYARRSATHIYALAKWIWQLVCFLGESEPPIPTVASPNIISASYFTNGANTTTDGLDLTGTYHTSFGKYGSVDWDLGVNFNTTRITSLAPRVSNKLTPDGERPHQNNHDTPQADRRVTPNCATRPCATCAAGDRSGI